MFIRKVFHLVANDDDDDDDDRSDDDVDDGVDFRGFDAKRSKVASSKFYHTEQQQQLSLEEKKTFGVIGKQCGPCIKPISELIWKKEENVVIVAAAVVAVVAVVVFCRK